MDFSSITSSSFNLNQNSNAFDLKNMNSKTNSNKEISYASKITLVKKGQAGYMKAMDVDDDGKITLEEFNEYCKENGLSESDRIKLLTCMEVSKMNEKIYKETEKAQEESKKDEDKNKEKSEDKEKSVYAKKGDDNYNEEMDLDKNDEITYAEYFAYISKKGDTSSTEKVEKSNNDNTSSENTSEENVYSNEADTETYEAKTIEPEVQSTVEFDV